MVAVAVALEAVVAVAAVIAVVAIVVVAHTQKRTHACTAEF